MAGDNDHFRRDPGGLDPPQNLEPVDHRHHQVHEDDIERAGQCRLQAFVRILAIEHVMAFGGE